MFKITNLPLEIRRAKYLDSLLRTNRLNNPEEFVEHTKTICRRLHIVEEFIRNLIPNPDDRTVFKTVQILANERDIKEYVRNQRRARFNELRLSNIEPLIEHEFGYDDSSEINEDLIASVWERGAPL